MKVPHCTIYTKSAGMEIGPYEKRSEGKPREGRISLRFFKMESGSQQLRFVAEPASSKSAWSHLRAVTDSIFTKGIVGVTS